ncbi:MAG: YbaB/EbfC family nucleoid-associated protein [Alphaproteobacteria bacterium]|jgi:hypothetical protein|nr:YbaB/EbfC family nucleoid-associated protein [Rhodospirillaceae bacterium]MDP6021261.1 YbaB/EbfC family nucleoid-associated protein [Alphaproteobacteria bacterium]MDP6257200.1 YbaB/EbfC family nucleoid-associated protein [Alphaproteobacteria bacterium]MDP7054034.1 YbaB/EbfC family nucleoid-associated protein [Alphaproteobacteria bacterium]MDP7227345.1 YbaB/EbfC family nucleoid-associated protein [Alphaproteobacteria bacterium]|tara:strand:+ start:3463 stop:3783 length:321 start_codon:yes stop_codon:yes gene_type:complete
MKNLSQMMKQAQEMQGKIEEMQARMEGVEMTGQAGAGLVSVTLNGKGEMRGLKMDASIKDGDMEVMEDLIIAAHNDAKRRVEEFTQEEMSKLTGGLNLPAGMKLPF